MAQTPLSPDWAFVLRLRERTPSTAAEMHGRIEHIVSGQTADFTSLAELHAFLQRVVAELGSKGSSLF